MNKKFLGLMVILCPAILAVNNCKEPPYVELKFEGYTPLNTLAASADVKDAEDVKEKMKNAKSVADRVAAKDTRKIAPVCSVCNKPVGWGAKSCTNGGCTANGIPYVKVPSYKCLYCKGTGVCPTCRTWGMHEGEQKGRCHNCELIQKQNDIPRGYVRGHTLDWKTPVLCKNCSGTNRCPICRGTAECDFCSGDGELDAEEVGRRLGAVEVIEEEDKDEKKDKKKKKKDEEEE